MMFSTCYMHTKCLLDTCALRSKGQTQMLVYVSQVLGPEGH